MVFQVVHECSFCLIAGLALKDSPPSSDLAKLGSLSQESIDLMCAPRKGTKPLRPLNDSSWENLLPAEGRYIDYRFRDEATFLTDPNIQRALGCEPSPRMGTCMAQFPKAMTDWGSRLPEASVPRAAPVPAVR